MLKKILKYSLVLTGAFFTQLDGSAAAANAGSGTGIDPAALRRATAGSSLEIAEEYPLEHAPLVAYLKAISANGIIFRNNTAIEVASYKGTFLNYATQARSGEIASGLVMTTASTVIFSVESEYLTAAELNAKTKAFQEGKMLSKAPLAPGELLEKVLLGTGLVDAKTALEGMGFEKMVTALEERDKTFVGYLISISKNGSVYVNKKPDAKETVAHYAVIDKENNFCQGMVIILEGKTYFALLKGDRRSVYTEEKLKEFLG